MTDGPKIAEVHRDVIKEHLLASQGRAGEPILLSGLFRRRRGRLIPHLEADKPSGVPRSCGLGTTGDRPADLIVSGENERDLVDHEAFEIDSDRFSTISSVGQITIDTNILLDQRIALGDQVTGIRTRRLGGTAAIVAHNAAVLGGNRVIFHGLVGRDNADEALKELTSGGVRVGSTIPTDQSEVLVLIEPGGQRTMVASLTYGDWSRFSIEFTAREIVFFEGWPLFDPSTRPYYRQLVVSAVQAGAFVALDVCSGSRADSAAEHAELISSLGVSLVLANATEARAYRLLERPPAPLVVVHAGDQATTILDHGRRCSAPVIRQDVLDSTGAGDTFAAGFLVALSKGASAVAAAGAANRAAGLILGQIGALLPVREFVDEKTQSMKGAS
jgi:fructokinase